MPVTAVAVKVLFVFGFVDLEYGRYLFDIFKIYSLFAGLFLPVGAIACEAVYEVFTGITRKS